MFSKHRLCTEKPVTLSEQCIQLIIQVYGTLYRYMFWKHRLCTEKPVTLSEPCMHTTHYTGLCSENTGYVPRNQSHYLNHAYSPLHRSEPCMQLIIKDYVLKTQAWFWETRHTVWTINTAHYTGIWSQNTGYVLWNQSHCLDHAYSPLHRSKPCMHLIIKDYVLKTQAWYWETSHTVLTINTAHYTGIWSQNTGLVLRNQSHCLNHAYSPLHRSEPCIQFIIKDYVLKTLAMYCETSHIVWTMHTAHYTGLNHAYSPL